MQYLNFSEDAAWVGHSNSPAAWTAKTLHTQRRLLHSQAAAVGSLRQLDMLMLLG